jgi:peptidoglycan/LPS O-acetylase OafA/YrhL
MVSFPEKRVFHSLDAARGVAAIAVVVYHSHLLLGAQWFESGFLAVDFFFGLSGFVLAHAYGTRLASRRMSTREFMVARLIRLYPLYLLSMALIVLMLATMAALSMDLPWSRTALVAKLPLAVAMLPSPSLDPRGYLYTFNIPAWSILFEILVNLLFAVFCRPLMTAWIRWTAIGISAAILVIQLVVLGIEQGGPTWNTAAAGIPRVVFSFLLGVQLYDWHRRRVAEDGGRARHSGWTLLGLVVLLACLAAPAEPALELASSLLIFPLLILVLAECDLRIGVLGPALRQLGIVSYAVYMLHAPVGDGYTALMTFLGVSPEGKPAGAIASIACLVLLSLVADRVFDRPVRAYLQKRGGHRFIQRHLDLLRGR